MFVLDITGDCYMLGVTSSDEPAVSPFPTALKGKGSVWLCRAVYGYVGLCTALWGCVSLCRAMYGYVRLCRVMYSYVGLCRAM